METNNPVRELSFWTKVLVDFPDKCWIWLGAKDQKGYGNYTVAKGKTSKAHRFSYALHYGEIAAGMQVDHECENTSCVNPFCLQLLTGMKNNEKSNSASAVNKRKTHCIRGHEFSDDNIIKRRGRRICIICEKERRHL